MFQNIILLSKDYNIIKQNDPHDSEMRAAAVEYQKFFFLWDRSQGDVIRRSLHYPVWASPDSSWAPTSARLTGLIKSRNSASTGLNWEPHG